MSERRRGVDCLFCKIVDKQIPAKIIDESDKAIAFLDVSPVSDGHCLVIPKNHSLDFMIADDEDLIAVTLLAKKVAKTIEASKLKPAGFNFLSNQGHIAGQRVFHYHMHVIPKYAVNEGIKFDQNVKLDHDIDQVYNLLTK